MFAQLSIVTAEKHNALLVPNAALITGDNQTRVVAIENDSPLAAQAHYSLAGLYRKQGKAQEAEREMRAFHKLERR